MIVGLVIVAILDFVMLTLCISAGRADAEMERLWEVKNYEKYNGKNGQGC